MARKVFISFLGTTNYVECCYDIDKDNPVRFVQEALIRNICKDWTENDQIYIFCTEGAENNWYDNRQKYITEEIQKIGLETRLNKLKINGLKTPFEKVHIEEGFSEDEIWKIFETVENKIQENDLIYFDVTHAFRSIPLFSTVLFNYTRFMKNTKIESIKYGAFEKLGPANLVKNIPVKERVAPIIDLTNVARLQEYNEMASNVLNFGKTKKLTSELKNINENNNILSDLCLSINQLDEYIATNQLTTIREGKFIAKFRNNVKPIAKKQPKPIQNILNRIKTETECFVSSKDNKNIEAAIQWAKNHEMLVQAYSLLEEYIVLRISENFDTKNPFGKNSKLRKQWREFIELVLGIPEESISKNDFRGILEGYEELVKELLNQEIIIEIRPKYEEIRKRRNSIVHGNGEFDYEDLNADFDSKYKECLDIINIDNQ